MKELITLTMEEQNRYQVIKDSLEGKIKVKQACLILGLCIRQIYRLSQRVKKGSEWKESSLSLEDLIF